MKTPKLDNRTDESIERQIRELAAAYLPEWRPEAGEAGWALAQSFAKMEEEVIERLNRVPEKLFIDFLDRLGFRLHPPSSARVPVTFVPAEGMKENRKVAEGSRVSDERGTLFETEKEFTVTPAKLAALFSVDPSESAGSASMESMKSDDGISEGKENPRDEKNGAEGNIDFMFSNDGSVYLSENPTCLYPFGTEPRLGDRFYIGSSGLFSRKDVWITMDIRVCEEPKTRYPEPAVLWEYWSGKSWRRLDIQCNFLEDRMVSFLSPRIEEGVVNGEKSRWIRARLIGGGYGSYVSIKGKSDCCEDPPVQTDEYGTVPRFTPPKIERISFEVSEIGSGVSHSPKEEAEKDFPGLVREPSGLWRSDGDLILKSRVEMTETLAGELPDRKRALYLGFDRPFGEGTVSILFVFSKSYRPFERELEWSYVGTDGWKPLKVKDETHGLLRTGICEFLAPSDQKRRKIGNRSLYWLRVVFGDRIGFPSRSGGVRPEIFSSEKEERGCRGEIVPFHPALHASVEGKETLVELECIAMNTVWTKQSERVEEYLGSSDGSPGQRFELSRPPVESARIWIREPWPPEKGAVVRSEGRESWVRWEEVGTFYGTGPASRVYTLDPTTGEIRFGDGVEGMIPPAGKDVVKAEYRRGGGETGNVPKGKIDTLFSTIASIEKVTNPLPATGGAEAENVESLIRRAPGTLRTANRAVTAEDYEILTKEAFRELAKVKAIPNFNEAGEYERGWTTVVVVPEGGEERPECPEEVIERVRSYLEERAPLTARLQVVPPRYAAVDLEISVVLKRWNAVSSVKETVTERLKSFLHPIHGGNEGEGWAFGAVPCFSDFFAVLDSIEAIDCVKSLKMRISTEEKTYVLDAGSVRILEAAPYVLVCSGTHTLKVEGA